MALNPKQRDFCREYRRDKNATRAAIRAGYSERSAHTIGWDLLQKPEVQDEIARLEAESAARLNVTIDRVKAETARIAFADVRDVTKWGVGEVKIGLDAEGKRLPWDQMDDAVVIHTMEQPFVTPIDSDELDPDIAAAVSEVSLGKEGFKIKMHSKTQALDMLAKMVGAYAPERHDHTLTGKDGEPLDVALSPADLYRAMKEG